MPDLEVRIARFLEQPLAVIKDPAQPLSSPVYPGARLRRVRDLDRDRLAPAIHTALRVAKAVVRALRDPVEPRAIPSDGLIWRTQIEASGPVDLDDVLADLWSRGVPVVPLDLLPAPSFQGLACIVGGRPVILLGHRHDEPGRVAFIVAHEAGHIAGDHCEEGSPVVDEDEAIEDESPMERDADQFAIRTLVGNDDVPAIDAGDFRQLAKTAVAVERASGADASACIFAWARKTGDYGMATMAVHALYRAKGASRSLRRHLDQHVDLEGATESDRNLLRLVRGDPAPG